MFGGASNFFPGLRTVMQASATVSVTRNAAVAAAPMRTVGNLINMGMLLANGAAPVNAFGQTVLPDRVPTIIHPIFIALMKVKVAGFGPVNTLLGDFTWNTNMVDTSRFLSVNPNNAAAANVGGQQMWVFPETWKNGPQEWTDLFASSHIVGSDRVIAINMLNHFQVDCILGLNAMGGAQVINYVSKYMTPLPAIGTDVQPEPLTTAMTAVIADERGTSDADVSLNIIQFRFPNGQPPPQLLGYIMAVRTIPKVQALDLRSYWPSISLTNAAIALSIITSRVTQNKPGVIPVTARVRTTAFQYLSDRVMPMFSMGKSKETKKLLNSWDPEASTESKEQSGDGGVPARTPGTQEQQVGSQDDA